MKNNTRLVMRHLLVLVLIIISMRAYSHDCYVSYNEDEYSRAIKYFDEMKFEQQIKVTMCMHELKTSLYLIHAMDQKLTEKILSNKNQILRLLAFTFRIETPQDFEYYLKYANDDLEKYTLAEGWVYSLRLYEGGTDNSRPDTALNEHGTAILKNQVCPVILNIENAHHIKTINQEICAGKISITSFEGIRDRLYGKELNERLDSYIRKYSCWKIGYINIKSIKNKHLNQH